MAQKSPAVPADPTFARWEDLGPIRNRERWIVGAMLFVVLVLSLLDAIEDWQQGLSVAAFLVDGVYVLAMFAVLAYLWRFTPVALTRSHRRLTREVIAQHGDMEQWRQRASTVVHGLGQLIEQQFADWGLSEAEREVGFLLLKGLSLREISAIRDTSDRTVRQQASAIYAKAGLSGRAELSAFFLEDLLTPPGT